MAVESPYKLFWNWVFDGKKDSPIPSPEVLLKYNSPIHETFILKSFMLHRRLNHYLNSYMNNIGIRYIDKEELFFFAKKCVRDFKVRRKDIHFSRYKPQVLLVQKLKKKFPLLKSYDIELLAEEIHKGKDRDSIYSALGLEKPKKQKLKAKSKKKKINLKTFLADNFSIKVEK